MASEGRLTPEQSQRMIAEVRDELYARATERLQPEDMARVRSAFEFANGAHAGQQRKSGIPYITHPVAVARIVLVELSLDASSIIAALLHDVVEDTEYTLDDIEQNFGPEVRLLVDVLTKKEASEYKVSKQIDNFRQMLDSINYDIRALLIKLSDRLHNMRTLDSMRPDKQMKIASETDYFYAPLANRLGLYEIKSELENLSMKFRSPQEYERIEKKVVSYMRLHQPDIDAFLNPIRAALPKAGIYMARVYARPRSVYALWRKMQATGMTFKELEHIHLVQVVFPFDAQSGLSEKNQCLHVYSVLTDLYKERPYSMINYIDQPKENGYQAIHVQVMTSRGGWAEVHICTEEMHRASQMGCVTHRGEGVDHWVENFRSVLKDIARSGADSSFMESVVSSFYNDDIIAFTPEGDSRVLPKGSTVLDMAFEIHTDIGLHAKFARINGKLSSIFTVLRRGDRVEIGTDPMMLPTPQWLDHVTTYKARRAVSVALSKKGNAADRISVIQGGQEKSLAYSVCPICQPLPGDEISGFVQPGGSVLVHKRNCKEAIQLSARDGDSIVDVSLPILPGKTYPTQITINGVDRAGLLYDLVKVITGDLHLYIDELQTVTEDYIVTLHVRFRVPSAFELDEACRVIEGIEGVEEVRIA